MERNIQRDFSELKIRGSRRQHLEPVRFYCLYGGQRQSTFCLKGVCLINGCTNSFKWAVVTSKAHNQESSSPLPQPPPASHRRSSPASSSPLWIQHRVHVQQHRKHLLEWLLVWLHSQLTSTLAVKLQVKRQYGLFTSVATQSSVWH